MPKGRTPSRIQLDNDAQDLVAELGINPMTVDEIMQRYDRSRANVHHSLLKRAREFARANAIVIDRPVVTDGYLYRARWEWNGSQAPNWQTMLADLLSRAKGMRADLATYTANARAEGQDDLADVLEDIHDLFKVTTKSIEKARLQVKP
jgi:hypothetical protein